MDSNFEKGITTLCGSPENLNTWIYRQNDTGLYVHEIRIESIKPNHEKTEIVQITDIHLNYTNDEDKDDDEVMLSKQFRIWNKDGASVKALKKSMAYAKQYDQTVITGDTIDYLSHGAMELMQKYVWDENPDCIAAIGWHDLTKQMQTKQRNRLPLEERQAILEKFWKHDIYYYSRVIHDNVMIIQMDNSCHRYWDFQIPKLKNDLEKARKNKYTVLIFQHEPISTGKDEDADCPSYYVWADCATSRNFFDQCIGFEPHADVTTMTVYELITKNADIIKGIFCGHYHTCFYTEVDGEYTDENGKVHYKTIPQHLLECNVYDDYSGHVLKITVE